MSEAGSFEKEFSVLRELGEGVFVLRGSSMIVEIKPDEEIKTAGGIVIATSINQTRGNSIEQHRLQVAKVLMTGPGYWVEKDYSYPDDLSSQPKLMKGDYEALEVKPGAIIILPQFAAQLISVFPGIQRPTGNKLALVKMDSILAYYPSEAAFQTAKAKLS